MNLQENQKPEKQEREGGSKKERKKKKKKERKGGQEGEGGRKPKDLSSMVSPGAPVNKSQREATS